MIEVIVRKLEDNSEQFIKLSHLIKDEVLFVINIVWCS